VHKEAPDDKKVFYIVAISSIGARAPAVVGAGASAH